MRLASLLLLASAAAHADGKLLSVLELRNKLEGDARRAVDASYISDRIRAEVLDQRLGVQVMTRENMLVLLQSQGKSLAECEGECEVDTGRRLGADYVISGDVLRVGSLLKVSLKLHDTHGGTLLGAIAASGVDVEALDASLPAAVKHLTRALQPATPAPPPAAAAPSAAEPKRESAATGTRSAMPAADAVSMSIPAPPEGRWLLVTEDGSMLCELPCKQRLARGAAYFAERDADKTADRTRLHIPRADQFGPGRSAEAEYLSGRGSSGWGMALLVLGLSGGAFGVGMISAIHDTYCYSNGQCYDGAQTGLGTVTMGKSPDPTLAKGIFVGGIVATAAGIVLWAISRDEHYEARVASGQASLELTSSGLALRF
jgi:TolB-like protein